MKSNSNRLKEIKVYRKRNIWNEWKKKDNLQKNSVKKDKKPKSEFRNLYKSKIRTLKVPNDFSLITNTEGVLEFADRCKKMIEKNINTLHIDFSDVTEISHGTMALLLSITHDLNSYNINVSGNLPIDSTAKTIFTESGFLDFFKINIPLTKKTKSTILVRGGDKIDQIRTAPQIEKAMETVFENHTRNQKLQGMIIEMMTNSVNHAFYLKKQHTKWYLSVFHLEEEKKVKFCFIDNGEGILKTIHFKFLSSLRNIVLPEDVLKKAFDGAYGSRTKQKERGTGLLTIKSCFVQKTISNLKVITNNLFYDFATEEVKQLRNNFKGTFYFWELDTTCKNVNY